MVSNQNEGGPFELAGFVEFFTFTGERLKTWEADMGKEKFRIITGDYSKRPGYAQDVTTCENPPRKKERPDGASVVTRTMREEWGGGGKRITQVYSDGKVTIEFEDERGYLGISTTCTESSLFQKTGCTLGRARENTRYPLIAGEEKFFRVASSLLPPDAVFSEELSVKYRDGGKIVDRHLCASNDQWTGGREDMCITTVVTSDNGLIKCGSGKHEPGFYRPLMRVVE